MTYFPPLVSALFHCATLAISLPLPLPVKPIPSSDTSYAFLGNSSPYLYLAYFFNFSCLLYLASQMYLHGSIYLKKKFPNQSISSTFFSMLYYSHITMVNHTICILVYFAFPRVVRTLCLLFTVITPRLITVLVM